MNVSKGLKNYSSTPMPGQIGLFDQNSNFGSSLAGGTNGHGGGMGLGHGVNKSLPFHKPPTLKNIFRKSFNGTDSASQLSGRGDIGGPGSTYGGKNGLHRSLNLDLFPIGTHWHLDARSISHVHNDFCQITSQGTTFKVRDEARAHQRRMIKMNSHGHSRSLSQ